MRVCVSACVCVCVRVCERTQTCKHRRWILWTHTCIYVPTTGAGAAAVAATQDTKMLDVRKRETKREKLVAHKKVRKSWKRRRRRRITACLYNMRTYITILYIVITRAATTATATHRRNYNLPFVSSFFPLFCSFFFFFFLQQHSRLFIVK